MVDEVVVVGVAGAPGVAGGVGVGDRQVVAVVGVLVRRGHQ